ncbi:hypothetical protein TNCV_4754301 [Trichonephila clavipes]|nr:hypothetical protein TNCV_4754301 [Trichonephila clavipes]
MLLDFFFAARVKNGRSLQGKLADGTVVDVEAGASFYTYPIFDEDSLFHSDSSLKTFRDVKIHASKLRLLACRHSSNCNDLLPNMKTQRSAMSLKRLLPDTGLRVLRTQVPE